ncbi:MAG: glycoside hydrolase family 1 protein [Patescibacteria group bacterium]
MEKKALQFPKGFLWGAATSAHQVEGGNTNDWSEWEKEHAERFAEEAKKHWEPWQQERFPEMFDPANYISGKAADHYHRYEEDFDIAKSLGHNAHRFSIEWSRIEPEEGKFDTKEIEHYRQVIQALKKRGLEPFVTIWHWPLPLWLAEKGGWEAPGATMYFERYAAKLASLFKDDVRFWITINESQIYALHGYTTGEWPPGKKNVFLYFWVIHKIIGAHKKAYQAIKSLAPLAQVGVATHNIYFEAHQNTFINRMLKKAVDWWWNDYFLNKISRYQDFVGLNNYLHNRIDYGFNKNENMKLSDMGWELYPEALYYTLMGLKKYHVPVYVMESGLADADDSRREWFIKALVEQVYRANKSGVDVRGFLYWSLLDNFEWDKGFWPRFGLVEIDYQTLERKIRPSARAYAEICRSNSLIQKE